MLRREANHPDCHKFPPLPNAAGAVAKERNSLFPLPVGMSPSFCGHCSSDLLREAFNLPNHSTSFRVWWVPSATHVKDCVPQTGLAGQDGSSLPTPATSTCASGRVFARDWGRLLGHGTWGWELKTGRFWANQVGVITPNV